MEGNSSYRRKLIRLVTFLGGVYFFFEFILPKPALEAIGIANFHTDISKGFRAFGTMAVGLGIINLLLVHGSKVVFLRKNSSYSIVLLLGLFSMMTVAALDWREGDQLTKTAAVYSHLADFSLIVAKDHEESKEGVLPYQERTKLLLRSANEALEQLPNHYRSDEYDPKDKILIDSYVSNLQRYSSEIRSAGEELESEETFVKEQYDALAGKLTNIRTELQKLLFAQQKYSLTKKLYNFLYQGLFVALGSAMFSLLAMYIAAAAYRAFRIKTLESALMMAAAIVVMLGQIPFYAYISGDLPFIRAWLLEVPNSAAFRAIKIGAAIAGLVMAFRMWFSIESESFSQGDKSS